MDKIIMLFQIIGLLASGLIGITLIGLIWIKVMEWTDCNGNRFNKIDLD